MPDHRQKERLEKTQEHIKIEEERARKQRIMSIMGLLTPDGTVSPTNGNVEKMERRRRGIQEYKRDLGYLQ